MLYSVPTIAAVDVIRERNRQIRAQAFTPDQHTPSTELAEAAIALMTHDADAWPWSQDTFKPKNPREDMVRAAALIIAAIEALDAAALPLDPSFEVVKPDQEVKDAQLA